VRALFILLPPGDSLPALLHSLPAAVQHQLAASTCRSYPPADDPAHLHSLLRTARDAFATQALPGMLRAVLGGAALGGITMTTLTAGFGMLGGLLSVGVPLGLLLGAFLGGFTAAMTGTESPRPELSALLARVRRGATLLQWSGGSPAALTALAEHCAGRGLPFARRDG
jgi:hypothetical protein